MSCLSSTRGNGIGLIEQQLLVDSSIVVQVGETESRRARDCTAHERQIPPLIARDWAKVSMCTSDHAEIFTLTYELYMPEHMCRCVHDMSTAQVLAIIATPHKLFMYVVF